MGALRGKNRKWLTLCVCSFMYLCGLFMITEGGMYVLQLVDNHSATYSALILGFYPYPRILWKAAWMFISPTIVVLILVFSWINYKGSSYDDYIFPAWANVLGWCITFSSVVCVPIVAIWKIFHEEGSLVARVQKLMQPSEDW